MRFQPPKNVPTSKNDATRSQKRRHPSAFGRELRGRCKFDKKSLKSGKYFERMFLCSNVRACEFARALHTKNTTQNTHWNGNYKIGNLVQNLRPFPRFMTHAWPCCKRDTRNECKLWCSDLTNVKSVACIRSQCLKCVNITSAFIT